MENGNGVHGRSCELDPTHYLERSPKLTNGSTYTLTNGASQHGQSALIILNSPLFDLESFSRLWDHASFRVCADGGANRLHDLVTGQLGDSSEMLRKFKPDLIHGDLDSLNSTVRKQYEQIGVEVSLDPDEYSTDFGKAINKVMQYLPSVRNILVAGSIGGRVDQGIGLLHELYREQETRHPGVRFWLFSESSVSTILQTGSTVLHTPLKSALITRNLGILPLYGPAVISTEGLEWNVQDWPTKMGGQVSTSNHIVADRVSVTTNHEVLFTVERAFGR